MIKNADMIRKRNDVIQLDSVNPVNLNQAKL